MLSLTHNHQQPSNATKCISHVNIPFRSIFLSVRLFPASETAIASNHRKKQTLRNTQSTWVGHFYYSTLFFSFSCVSHKHTHTNTRDYLTNNNRTLVMLKIYHCMFCYEYEFDLFVALFWMFLFSAPFHIVYTRFISLHLY